VREFVELAFQEIEQEIVYVNDILLYSLLKNNFDFFSLWIFGSWEGEGINEIGKEKNTNIIRITVNPKHFRPSEVVSFIIKTLTRSDCIRHICRIS